jgi:hypothetical protein
MLFGSPDVRGTPARHHGATDRDNRRDPDEDHKHHPETTHRQPVLSRAAVPTPDAYKELASASYNWCRQPSRK